MLMYNSSKGPVPIDGMVYSHAKAALAKLYRDEPHRTTEIGALEMHVQKLAENPPEAAPVAGHNQPPEDAPTKGPMSWEAVKAHMDDLLTEAANWADGVAIDSQPKADTIANLRQQLQDAIKLADDARVEEKKPFDDKIAAIQTRYNEYIAPKQNKVPGRVTKSVTALGNLLTVWLNKLADEKEAQEKLLKEEADKAQAVAIEAHKAAAGATDLAAVDEAEALMAAADDAQKALRSVETQKVQAKGAYRAVGLRTTWIATLDEGGGGKALKHYAQNAPERVKAFLQELADQDVKDGVRTIPGFTITPERKV